MYINFISHNTEKSSSSSNVFHYLEKENEMSKLKNETLILEGRDDEVNKNLEEYFFNQDFDINNQLDDPNGKINIWEAIEGIDNNRGTQNLSSSNFYMLNISPSERELKHMENLAEQELNRRGLFWENCKGNSETESYYQEQKDQLMKAQMKIYTKEMMEEYARSMNREIYAHQDRLPSNEERKTLQPEIDRRYNKMLVEKGLKERIGNEYILVSCDKKIPSNIEGVNTYIFKYNGEEQIIYATQNKVKEIGENTLAIDKQYLENKIKEEKDKEAGIYTDEKIRLEVQIDKELGNSTMVVIEPTGYNEKVRMWINNKDFKKLENGEIEMNKYKADRLISSAIDRDKEQKQLVEIHFSNVEAKKIKGKEDAIFIFKQKIEGLKEPITITFKKEELKTAGGKYLVEKYKLDYRVKKAKDLGITAEFSSVKDDIKHQVWRENGFDPTKRSIEGKDLLYFAKVETQRTYKHTDKAVLKNRPILQQIEEYEKNITPINQEKIKELEKELLRDKHTGEVIKEGVKKGGLQYHTHIVVSRHDRTSVNPRDKVSMSPMANHKEGYTNMGAKVGFNRDNFFRRSEQIFDNKFEYQRPIQEQYHYKNEVSKEIRGKVEGVVKGEIKKQIMEHTGMRVVKNELNPIQKVKQEIMPIPLPTSFPKSAVDLAFKIAKTIKKVIDTGIQY